MNKYPETSGSRATAELNSRRERMEVALQGRPMAPSVKTSERLIGGVYVLEFIPQDAVDSSILYFHGGGFRMGSPHALAPYLSALAEATSHRILAVKYRLAPENPFPAALNDALAVIEEIRRDDPHPIVVAGDSAGGGLAASLLLAAPTEVMHGIAGAVLLCPWVDMRLTNRSWIECAKSDALFSRDAAEDASRSYLGSEGITSPDDPLVSPVLGDWRHSPPVLIQASSSEVLRDDARALARAAMRAGVRVWYQEYRDEAHVWHYWHPNNRGSRAAFAQIHEFLGQLARRADDTPE